jgi:hypothetical protein
MFRDPVELNKAESGERNIWKIHSDVCNVPQYLLPGVRLQIKFSKAKSGLINTDVPSETTLKFLDAQLRVNRIRPNPHIQVAHNTVNSKGGKARYSITRVELKSFTFSSGL